MRKITILIGTKAEYGLLKPVMLVINKDPDLNLEIISTGVHLSKKLGYTHDEIINDRFSNVHKIETGHEEELGYNMGKIIGDEVQMGSHCSIYSVSTIDDNEGKVILKKNCRIGTHSVVMPGITIGENSVIDAFSFVNNDIPDNVVAFGTHAKVRRKLK